jgi:tetratricopeptide (TPR) repeat protein
LNELKRFPEALELQSKAVQMCNESFEMHGDTPVIVRLNLGWVHLRQRDYQKAKDILNDARRRKPNSPPVLYALANLHSEGGNLEIALGLHLQTLNLYRDQLGEHHHCTADSYYKVGETHLRLGNLPEAMLVLASTDHNTKLTDIVSCHLLEALKFYRSEKTKFDTRPGIARSARMLASALERSGTCDPTMPSAKDLFDEAHGIYFELKGVFGCKTQPREEYDDLFFYWSR